MAIQSLTFIDNKIIDGKKDKYINVHVNAEKVLKSWKSSVFSFEWLKPDGTIKPIEALADSEKAKRVDVEAALKKGEAVETPILGIGLMENVEIGVGKAVFLTLCDKGETTIPVHIPKSNEADFSKYITAKA